MQHERQMRKCIIDFSYTKLEPGQYKKAMVEIYIIRLEMGTMQRCVKEVVS